MSSVHKTLLVAALPLLLAACAATPARAQSPAPHDHAQSHAPESTGRASEPVARSPLAVPLDAATLARLPRERLQASAHGKPLDCEGVALPALLRLAGALPAERLPGAQLARYVLVDARDGYRVLYSLAELDPGTGNAKVLLVDRCNGTPLPDNDGPLRLLAPGDVRPARWVRQVKSITVVDAP